MENSLTMCFGSNTADGLHIIEDALCRIADVIDVDVKSEIYKTPSYNGIGNDYYNMVIVCRTSMSLTEITAYTKQVEICFGRTPKSKAIGVVPIDIDIVYWNNKVIRPEEASRQYFMYGFEQCKLCK